MKNSPHTSASLTLRLQRAKAEAERVHRERTTSATGAAGVGLPCLDWTPLPGPQLMAYESEADILGYGGAAGGGKSQLLLGLALTRHRKAIVFRREATQLRDLISESRTIIGEQGKLNENTMLWRGLPGNRSLEFGGVKTADDVAKYKGRPHDLKAFDEATELLESQFRFLIAWNRTVIPGQRCRVIAAFNPPTSAEGQWVIQYWGPWLDPEHPNPALPGELRWYAMVSGEEVARPTGEVFEHKGERIKPLSRTFIPARLDDNPYLKSTDYEATLQSLPEPLRSQLLHGDFRAGIQDDSRQVIPSEWVRLANKRWMAAAKPQEPPDVLGVDVARGGKDQTVIARRYGNWFGPLEKHPGTLTPDGPMVAALVINAVADGSPLVNVDVIGVGASVYDCLRNGGLPETQGVNFASGSGKTDRSGKLRLRNKRAECYWRLREALDPASGEEIALPPDSELLADLCAPTWKLTTQGIQIESKEEIHARIGRSPDCGDAVALTFAESEVYRIDIIY